MAIRDASPTSDTSMLSSTSATEKDPVLRDSSTASPPTSTPPTSLGDEASIMSDVAKMEPSLEAEEETSLSLVATTVSSTPHHSAPEAPNSESRRPARSSRKSVTTYNVQILAGTAIHTPTKYLEKHHKNVLHGPIETVIKANPAPSPKKRAPRVKPDPNDFSDPVELQLATETAQAAQRRSSLRATDLRREALRNVTGVAANRRSLMHGALRRSASDSRLRSATQTAPSVSPKRPRAARGAESDDEDEEGEDGEEKTYLKPKTKQWMAQGMYVGQDRDFDARVSESRNRQRRKSRKPKEKNVLPLPMFAGERMLGGDVRTAYRNFKLPYDTYNPLPRKVKVDGWVKLQKNRFIGDASALWKRDKQDSSQCYCDPEDGCGEACHNRIMAYECDNTNCPLPAEKCNNRPFAQLKKRAKGNGYDYGVEVMETEDKGYGVRAMRTFEPHQIIVEYAGEIITQTECERRMKQIYKKDKCYYLMSFDNKMIIDATRGTIARFVNHSCEPNCEMIKWTVGGEPRMALFAGRRGIMTGEELTYDYNFDPFSLKNIQECRCGTRSCRGVLGPKPKKPLYEERTFTSALIAGTKRKLQEVVGWARKSESAPNSPKKRILSTSALTKQRNALAEKTAVREKAQKDAADHAAQIASREDRALKRSKSMTLSRRSTKLRRAARSSMPNLTAFRHTSFSLQRRIAKPGALKPVKRLSTVLRRTAITPKAKKGLPPNRTSRAAIRSPTPDSSEDESPNITPASLRSATKKFTQTKLPFKALHLGKEPPSPTSDSASGPDSDDERARGAYAKAGLKGKKRGSAPAPRGMHKTGAGVTKASKRVRNSRGVFVKGRG